MEKYYSSLFKKKVMASTQIQTVVGVKQVKQEVPEEWEESMPLPGDIIEGIVDDDADNLFVPVKGRSDFSSQLGKISRMAEDILLKVRRGENVLKLRVCVVQERCSKLQRRFTFRAASDDRHVAVLGDLTLEQCTELQEMSRKVVNVDYRGFNRKGVKYDWRMKVGTYLPDHRSTVISSILFMPLVGENGIEATIVRTMAWFNAAVSSGTPLVFVNIQTEQIVTSEKSSPIGKEMSWGRQQNYTSTVQIVQGIRLWFLPGVAEVLLELAPEPGEARFGMDIKRTEEGFICISSVTKGTAADRAGLGCLHEQATKTGHKIVISRLEGKSLIPSSASSGGQIHCCDQTDIKETLISAMDRMENIKLHIMAWPNKTPPNIPKQSGVATLLPPSFVCPVCNS